MYYKDLTLYDNDHPNIFNIGWLENNDFNQGDLPDDILEKLISMMDKTHANQMRGTHICTFCGDNAVYGRYQIIGKELFLGSAELWIPNIDFKKIHVVPDLILHYIESHRYLPPKEFLDAVNDFKLDSDWTAEEISFLRN